MRLVGQYEKCKTESDEQKRRGVAHVFTAGRIGQWPSFWIFRTIWAMAPVLGGDFLGEDYGLFWRAVAYTLIL